ncbi:MAG: hypothetical protein SGARI_004169 [Bacillariaceae sp.]
MNNNDDDDIVDLTADDNDELTSKPAAAAASKPVAAQDDDGVLEVWSGDKPSQPPAQKKRRKHGTAAAAAASAIDITGDAALLQLTPEEKYKSELGPLRMEFVSEDGFLKSHAMGTVTDTSMEQMKTRKWHREVVEYRLNLPITPSGSIFVRVHESRLDLVRAMITGPEGTPYQNGCFFFDFHMKDYPNSPPKAKFLTTGGAKVRFNPNLYNCGKVIPEPFYNEPGYEKRRNDAQSILYNKNIRKQTLIWAIQDPLRRSLDMLEGVTSEKSSAGRKRAPKTLKKIGDGFDYPEFAHVVVMHFVQKAEQIDTQLTEWTKMDPSLKSQANSIRSLIQRAMRQNYDPPSQEPTKAAPAALKKAASAKKPPPPDADVIEIL